MESVAFCGKGTKKRYKSKESAYKSLVRPVMEYGAARWDPYRLEDIKTLENIKKTGSQAMALEISSNDAETDQEEEKELAESVVEKKLPSEGCTGRNGEREKSSGQKKSDDKTAIRQYGAYEETKRKAENRKDWRILGLQ
ncbi:hypothetical protein ANN_09844 [Periplaneta americana]|uniref:Uncharacterized protein n=1 Tax=Periplaneta americana TaxID=6978 RepID=A0ABQ8TME7_PERAM|nr:hypothetical protein ANN_09844 [Periplaneta americana]